MDFENYLKEQCSYSNQTHYEALLENVQDIIKKEGIKLEYSFEECAKAYAKSIGVEYGEESKISFMNFLLMLGCTRHILNNIQNFKYYGYEKYLEEVKNNN